MTDNTETENGLYVADDETSETTHTETGRIRVSGGTGIDVAAHDTSTTNADATTNQTIRLNTRSAELKKIIDEEAERVRELRDHDPELAVVDEDTHDTLREDVEDHSMCEEAVDDGPRRYPTGADCEVVINGHMVPVSTISYTQQAADPNIAATNGFETRPPVTVDLETPDPTAMREAINTQDDVLLEVDMAHDLVIVPSAQTLDYSVDIPADGTASGQFTFVATEITYQ